MRACVYGAGAIGGHLAVRLAKGGADVSIIARGKHLAAIQANGLEVHAVDGVHKIKVQATDDPGTIGPVPRIPVARVLTSRLPLEKVNHPNEVLKAAKACLCSQAVWHLRDRRRQVSETKTPERLPPTPGARRRCPPHCWAPLHICEVVVQEQRRRSSPIPRVRSSLAMGSYIHP